MNRPVSEKIVASLLGLMAEVSEADRARACGMDVTSYRRWHALMDDAAANGDTAEMGRYER